MADTAEAINDALSGGERLRLVLICSMEESFPFRKRFVDEVLVGRLGWKIEGWDILRYCMLLTIVGNRLIKQIR